MLSPQSLLRGLVARVLPTTNPDSFNTDVALRMGRYGEVAMLPYVRKQHLLADEGSYFVANNNQSGVAEANNTTFSPTQPFVLIQNTDTGSSGKRIYLDYIALNTTVAGSAASGLTVINAAVVIDGILRYSSNGSILTPQSPNMDISVGSVALVAVGTVQATAASARARTICGLRTLRPCVSGAVADVVGEMKLLNFGSVEGATGSVTLANANVLPQAFPPIVIGPGQSAMLYVWQANGVTNVPASYSPEVGWWER